MIKARSSSASTMRKWFGGATAIALLLCYIAAAVVRGIEPGIEVFLMLFQVPFFIPSAIYYLRVSQPSAVLICGILLVAFTVPPAILTVLMVDEWRFAASLSVLAFVITLISSSVGAFFSRQSASPAGAA